MRKLFVALLLVLVTTAAQATMPTKAELIEVIDKAIAEAKRTQLPIHMSSGAIAITLYDYRRIDDVLIFDMRLDKADPKAVQAAQFKPSMIKWMRDKTCADPQRVEIMKYGFKWGYFVYDVNGGKLLEDSITLAMCK
jgi:hypothetical protein